MTKNMVIPTALWLIILTIATSQLWKRRRKTITFNLSLYHSIFLLEDKIELPSYHNPKLKNCKFPLNLFWIITYWRSRTWFPQNQHWGFRSCLLFQWKPPTPGSHHLMLAAPGPTIQMSALPCRGRQNSKKGESEQTFVWNAKKCCMCIIITTFAMYLYFSFCRFSICSVKTRSSCCMAACWKSEISTM